MGTLFLALIHVVFLIALSMRLRIIGISGKRILNLIFFSLFMWPVMFIIGLSFNISALLNFGGLTAIISVTMIYYAYYEFTVSVESNEDRAIRERELSDEVESHQKIIKNNEMQLASMFPIKTYIGDSASLLAISDLGKLKDNNIPCKIEGGIVKMLYVNKESSDIVIKLLGIEVETCDSASET